MEAWGAHHLPDFHAYYHDEVAVIGLDPVDLIAGSLPLRQRLASVACESFTR